MSIYTPDRWILVKLTSTESTYYRVLASWYGGYTEGDSWKLSSGIEKTIEYPDRYEYLNSSGSLYICYKGAEGTSNYTRGIFESYAKQNSDSLKIEIYNEGYII